MSCKLVNPLRLGIKILSLYPQPLEYFLAYRRDNKSLVTGERLIMKFFLYLWTFIILVFKNLGIGVNTEVPTSFQSSFWMTSSILLSGAMNMSVK